MSQQCPRAFRLFVRRFRPGGWRRSLSLVGVGAVALTAVTGTVASSMPVPAIAIITPDRGSVYGGGLVNIRLSGIEPFERSYSPDNYMVLFGGAVVSFDYNWQWRGILDGFRASGEDTLEVLVPPSPDYELGPVDVEVRVDVDRDGFDGDDDLVMLAEDGFEYASSPQVDAVWPRSGSVSGGDSVTISVSDFVPFPEETTEDIEVRFGGLLVDPDHIVRVDSNTIAVMSPPAADDADGVVDVEVSYADDYGILADGFRYERVFPSSGSVSGGTTVRLSRIAEVYDVWPGTEDGVGADDIDVLFNGRPGADVAIADDGSALTVVTPPSEDFTAGSVNVAVFVDGEPRFEWTDAYSYRPELEIANSGIERISQQVGRVVGGDVVDIQLWGVDLSAIFPSDVEVTFGGEVADVLLVPTPNVLVVATPQSPNYEEDFAATPVDVTVTLFPGTEDENVMTWANGFTYDTVFPRVAPLLGTHNGALDAADIRFSLPFEAPPLPDDLYGDMTVTLLIGDHEIDAGPAYADDAGTFLIEIPENEYRLSGWVDVVVNYFVDEPDEPCSSEDDSCTLVYEDAFEYLSVWPPAVNVHDLPTMLVTVSGMDDFTAEMSYPDFEVRYYVRRDDPDTDIDEEVYISADDWSVESTDTLSILPPLFYPDGGDYPFTGDVEIEVLYDDPSDNVGGIDLDSEVSVLFTDQFAFTRGAIPPRYDYGDYGFEPMGSLCTASDGNPIGVHQLVLGSLASRTQRGLLSGSGSEPNFTVSGEDSRGAYSFETDRPFGLTEDVPPFSDRFSRFYSDVEDSAWEPGWMREGTEVSAQDSLLEECYRIIQNAQVGGRTNIVQLESEFNCGNGIFNNMYSADPDLYSYCSIFGPEIYTEPFYAREGQSLSFDWGAQDVSDNYEIYAYLVRVDDPFVSDVIPSRSDYESAADLSYVGSHSLVLYSRGEGKESDEDVQFTTTSAEIPADGYWRFRFVNGSYDATGGKALGARMNLDPTIVVGETNEISFSGISDVTGSGIEVVLDVSSTSGEMVDLQSLTPSVCRVDYGAGAWYVTTLQTGARCTIRASQRAALPYSAASPVTRSFDVLTRDEPPNDSPPGDSPTPTSPVPPSTVPSLGAVDPTRRLAPGVIRVVEAGREVPASGSVDAGTRSVTIRAPGWEMRLVAALDPNGTSPAPLLSDGQLLLQSGRFAAVSGSGFRPNSDVRVHLFSSPLVLGSLRTDASGSFRGTVPIPADVASGEHTLQVNGLNSAGALRSTSLGVVLARASTSRLVVYFDAASSALTEASKRSIAAFARQTAALEPRRAQVSVAGYVRAGQISDEEAAFLSRRRASEVAKALRSAGLGGVYVVEGRGRIGQGGPTARRVVVTIEVLR